MSDQEGTSSVTDAQAADDTSTTAQAAGTTTAQEADVDEPKSLSPEDARKLRSEARAMRSRLKQAEDELKRRSDSELSDKQKLERDLNVEKAQREQLATEVRNLRVQVAAGKLGVRSEAVDRIGSMIDWSEVEDPSDARQVERAIRELVKEMPFLAREGMDGGRGRGTGARGEQDMNSIIRRAAGRA